MTDQGSRLLDQALHAARDVTSTAEDVERLRRRLDVTLASGSLITSATSMQQPTAAAWSSKAALWIVGAVVGLGGSVSLLSPHAPAARSVVLPPPASALQPVPSTPPVASDATASADTEPTLARESHAVGKHGHSHAGASRVATKVAQVSRSEAADPAAEVELITRAQALVRTQPAEALSLLLEHEDRFAHGILVQERETLRIDAERASGHSARAREHARAFIEAFPASPQTPALKQWLAAQESDATPHNPASAPVLTP